VGGSALGRNVALGLLLAVLLFLTAYPMGMLIYGSLHTTPPGEAGTFNRRPRAMLSRQNGLVLLNTIGLSLVKTGLALVFALFLAWVVARTDTPYRNTLEVLVTLPFYIPPILTAMAWGMLASPKGGAINLAWTALTGSREPLVNVYSYGGVVWHMMQYSTPFLFLLLVSAFRSMDPTLEDSSRMSGASPWTTFRRVTLGLMLPVTTSAVILSFIRGVESFESALIFGTPAGIEVITTEIYHLIHHTNRPDYPQATALALGIMVLMFGLVAWQWRLLGERSFVTVTGKGYNPRVTRRPLALGHLRGLRALLRRDRGAPCGAARGRLVLQVLRLLPCEHADGRPLPGRLAEPPGLARARQHLAPRSPGGHGHHGPGRSDRLRPGAHALPAPGRSRGAGLAALDDARHGAGDRSPLGLRADARAPPALRTLWALCRHISLGTRSGCRMAGAASGAASDLRVLAVHGAPWWTAFRRILLALAWPAFAVGWISSSRHPA
jgi:iron(III) transport system permease protein